MPKISDPLVTIPYSDQLPKPVESSITVSVYPHGVKTQHTGRIYGRPQTALSRGKITGFSSKAASRLRAFCIEHEVSGRESFAHSWTTRAVREPKEWKQIMVRMRKRCRRMDLPVIWRVQLQHKRRTPHLHCICFVKECSQNTELKNAWLRCTGEEHDKHARRIAVKFKPIENSGWAAYMAQRKSKHATDQNGWIGKQWNVWCREKLTMRQPMAIYHPTPNQLDRFRRTVERLLVPKNARKIRRRKLPKNRNWLRCVDGKETQRAMEWALGSISPNASTNPPPQP